MLVGALMSVFEGEKRNKIAWSLRVRVCLSATSLVIIIGGTARIGRARSLGIGIEVLYVCFTTTWERERKKGVVVTRSCLSIEFHWRGEPLSIGLCDFERMDIIKEEGADDTDHTSSGMRAGGGGGGGNVCMYVGELR